MPGSLLVLTHEYPPKRGGIATYAAETVEAARVLGHEVTVLTPRYTPAQSTGTLRITPTPVGGTQDWPDRLRMRRAVRDLERDWSTTTLWLPEPGPLRLWLYARLLDLPRPGRLVLTLHGSEILRLAWPGHRRRRLARLLGNADVVGVVSRAVAARLEAVTGFPAARCTLVPGAVPRALEIHLSGPLTPSPPAEKRLTVLTVGRIHPRKGQLEVVEALGALPEPMRAAVRYRLVGPIGRPAYLGAIEARARALGVALSGPEEAPDEATLAQIYRAADVFVLASRELPQSVEGLGLVYLEAAAAGCPVIAVDSGGAREAVGPENGTVVPPAPAGALTEALSRYLADGELRRRSGAAGPAWAREFSWARNARHLFGRSPAA
ncbi:MAG: glycosyltransferase family 4 protein [Opitutales bacterium]